MAFLDKPLDDLTEDDFQALVASGAAERKTIEYKSELPGTNDNAKKEYLADVSSFANASGGHLIFGIDAKDGVPTNVGGLGIGNADAEVLRLDTMVRDGLQPRLPASHYTRAVRLSSGRYLIVMRIPQSWNAPHMIIYQKWSRFYARNSNGNYPLDVGEIRSAFLRSEAFAERVRTFRVDRLAKITAGATPMPLPDAPKLIFHVVPFGAFDTGIRFDLAAPEQRTPVMASVHPVGAATTDTRYNFDGLLHSGRDSYVQMFRNGCIETVSASLLVQPDGGRVISSYAVEYRLIGALRSYLAFQKQLGVEPPLLVMLSLTGVLGATMVSSDPFRTALARDHSIDRDTLVVPEELVQDYDCAVEQVLKPCFDTVWNAAGWPRSESYDDAGHWIQRQQ